MALINPKGQSDVFHWPANWIAVTPHDSTALTNGTDDFVAKVLYVGSAGNVSVITAGGQTVTFAGAAAGQYLYGFFTHVRSTSTTASSILAGY